jgi:putative ABC transport system permease protein
MSGVLRTQLSGVSRRPARLLLTGLAMLVASFVIYATVLAQQITERTVLNNLSGTPSAVDFVLRGPGAKDLAGVAAVPGVAEAAGRTEAGGDIGGDYLNVTADPGSGPLAVTHVTRGRFPAAPREIAVTSRTADRMGLPIGTTVAMSLGYTDAGKPTPPVRVTVVGLVAARDDFGSTGYAPQRFITALTGEDSLSQIDVQLTPGADAQAVRAALNGIVAAVRVPADRPTLLTGAQVRKQEAEAAVDDVRELFAVVAMFVAIALVAAALVATSTFRIVFAQRMRQLALLRAVGAGRRSITGALAAEGALTGLVAGAVGVIGALAAGHLVAPLAHALGATHIAGPGVPIRAGLGVIVLAVVITVLAVLAPAVSAAKVAPLEALRASSTTAGRRDIGVLRWVFGLLLVVGAGVLAGYAGAKLPGRDPKDYNPAPVLLSIVASGALAFFALVSLGPVLMRPVLAAIGWPLRRLGPVGRLAVGGVGGAPRRAAAVSVVVALGVTLIAGVIVGGASVRVLTDRELATSAPADYEVTTSGDAALTDPMVTRARASRELKNVTPYRRLSAITIDSGKTELDANDLRLPALPSLGKLDVKSGALGALGPGTMVLSGFTADLTGLKTGDTATVRAGGRSVRLKVAALLPDLAPLRSGLVLDAADLTRLGAPATYSGLLADGTGTGESGRTAGRQALRQVIGGASGFGVTVLADQRDQINFNLDAVLAIAIGLVGLTVLIAVVGVGTTVALSVVERVRESGLLRAVGLSRAGLRGLLTAESALYGVIGAVIGLALGIPYAWLSIKALGQTIPLRVPVGQLAVVFLALVAFTALAGVLPARRAAKVSPVVALGTEA